MLISSRVPSRVPGRTYLRIARPVAIAAFSLGAALCGAFAHASQEAVDEVSRLLEQGKRPTRQQAEAYLKQNPADADALSAGRDRRGAAPERPGHQDLHGVDRDYPSLPEPYNNLAVLYAAEGQERKASEVLEQAIRTNPSYATAHENLGDLYARMASDAYAKALQLDGSRQAIQPKLALITQIFPKQGGAQGKTVQAAAASTKVADAKAADAKARESDAKLAEARAAETKAAEAKAAEFKAAEVKAADAKAAQAKAAEAKAAEAKAAEAKAAEAKLAQAKAAEAKAAETRLAQEKAAQAAQDKARAAEEARQAAAKAAAVTTTAAAPAAAAVAAAEPAKAAPAVDEKKAAQSAAAQEVEAAVKAWSTAWAGQDMDRYLDAYSDHFSPADGSSLAKWKEQRRQRIVGRTTIVVTVRDLKVTVDGDKATAQFRQYYASGALKTTTRKTLRMQREKGQWRITHEGTGS